MTTDKQKSPEARRANAEAAAWYLRIRNGEADAMDEGYLDWLAASPAHEAAMARARAAWGLFGEQATAPEIVKARSEALARAGSVSAERWRPLSVLPSEPGNLARAAALAGVFIAVALLVWWQTGHDRQEPANTAETFVTAVAETRTITLADNSRVSLDAASRIEVRYHDEARDITLRQGQAHFEVARDPARPFRVTAGNRTVVAIGTAFNVELVGEEVLVTLIEGKVVVESKAVGTAPAVTARTGRPILLKPGQLLTVTASTPPAVGEVDIERASAWRRGMVVLEGDSLETALERMNRHSRIRLEIGNPALAAYRISGVFHAGNTDAFVDAVENYFPVEARRMSASRIVLYPRE